MTSPLSFLTRRSSADVDQFASRARARWSSPAARRVLSAVSILLAAGLVIGLALHLSNTQAHSREMLRDSLHQRADLTADLIASAFFASTGAQVASEQFGGPRGEVSAKLRSANPGSRLVVLDDHGNVLGTNDDTVRRNPELVSLAAHVRAARQGSPALSDAVRGAQGRQTIEIAVPFVSAAGQQRVLVLGGSVDIVRSFTDGFFSRAAAVSDARGYLIDGRNRVLSASGPGASMRLSDRLKEALNRNAVGTVGRRTYVSADVPSSRWRLVLSVPSAALYEPVNGQTGQATWLMFAIFTLAIVAMMSLGAVAARATRRLAAATERERVAEELAHVRLHDNLTGLPGRNLFYQRAEQAVASARRHDRAMALVFVDIDDFKTINDSYGHHTGDHVLREVSRRLKTIARQSDTVARFGGDEFVLVLDETGSYGAQTIVQRVARAMSRPVIAGDDLGLVVRLSAGVAVHGGAADTRTVDDLIRDADEQMYQAKHIGAHEHSVAG